MSFTCPQCGMTSHNPMDASEGYCGNCHDWTGPSPYGSSHIGWYFDREGKRITMERFGVLHDDLDYKRVGLDVYPSLEDAADGDHPLDTEPVMTVSTVWLGIDHRFGGGGPPIIFETMIFGGPHDSEQWRYSTEEQAVEGHARVVEDLRAGRAPWWLDDEMASTGGDSEDGQ